MNKIEKLSFDEHDERVRPAPEVTDFDRIVEARISRVAMKIRSITEASVL